MQIESKECGIGLESFCDTVNKDQRLSVIWGRTKVDVD